MFEKVNPMHPDKVADRIAGALVDLAYSREENPKVAVEVLIGHGYCYVIAESSVKFKHEDVEPAVTRIVGKPLTVRLLSIPQDAHLAQNQADGFRCGDNGIFKGCPPTEEQRVLTAIAATMWERWPYDGKFIINEYRPTPSRALLSADENLEWEVSQRRRRDVLEEMDIILENAKERSFTKDEENAFNRLTDEDRKLSKRQKELIAKYEKVAREMRLRNLTICQSHAKNEELTEFLNSKLSTLNYQLKINPLGEWTGGPDVDTGATNRKLGSDMGDSVTGGGLMGKDLSKADVSVNTACFLRAQHSGQTVTAACAIGDKDVTFVYHAPSAALGDAQASLAPHSLARGFTYEDGHSETQSFSEIVEQARLYILTVGGFERFAEWGLLRPGRK